MFRINQFWWQYLLWVLRMYKICLYGGTMSKSRRAILHSEIWPIYYVTYCEQDLSQFVPLSALPSPACTRPKVETVAVLAQKLQDAWLCTKSTLEYIWMDAGFFERGLSQQVWR